MQTTAASTPTPALSERASSYPDTIVNSSVAEKFVTLAMAATMGATKAQEALIQVSLQCIRLADPVAWGDLGKQEEGRRLKEILVSVVNIVVARGHSPSLLFGAESEDEVDWMDCSDEEEEDEPVFVSPAADPTPDPAATPAPVLHPTHIIEYNRDWRPVHTNAKNKNKQYVLTETAGRREYLERMAKSTQATLKPVAPLPPTEDITRLRARPSGTYLLKGDVAHAVFLGPRGGKFVIVGGAKKWVRRAQRVTLLVTDADKAAMSPAAEE